VVLKDQLGNDLLAPSAMREELEYQDVWFVFEHRDGYSHSADVFPKVWRGLNLEH